ncbi:hypothetical protein BDL97_07G020400 [Sphagnum fallax]|nr:hypothetical protein BDL97_07G020400 [Sphagnum fallax]
MESRRVQRAISPQVVQQVVAAAAVSPTKQDLFGSGKKSGAARNTSRRALADKTNESPSAGLTPMMVKEGDRVGSFKGTPYPKLHELHKATAGVPAAEDVLCCTQVHTLPCKLEMGESGLHRMPSEFGTPGELAAPTPANTPINVPSSLGHTAFTPCFMIAPLVFEDKVDVSMSPGQEEEELNANSKTNACFPAGSSCVQWMETCVRAENKAEEGETLPLDTAAAMPPSTKEEKDRFCLTEPNARDINVVQHLEKVIWNLKKSPSLSNVSDVSTVTSTSSDWVRRDVEVGKHVDEDDEDDVSECSVVVNVSSPRLEERHDAPSKYSMADNRTEYSLQHMNSTQKAKSYQEEGFGEYNYYPEDDEDEYEDVELDGDCNELCDAISQFTMKENDDAGGLPVSTGQHIRFSYNSDDEIEALIVDAESPHQHDSPTALRLKGLPTPKGKHLRFNEEDIGSPSV